MTRDEVIKAITVHITPGLWCKGCPYICGEQCINEVLNDAIALLNGEPKRGRWEGWTATHWTGKYDDLGDPEYKEHVVYHCSLCGRRTVIREAYCPNCGAKMEGVDHD